MREVSAKMKMEVLVRFTLPTTDVSPLIFNPPEVKRE